MARKKKGKLAQLFIFKLQLWGVVARVAATHVNAAKRMLADRHHFRGAWVSSPTVSSMILGWDEESGWRARARNGGDIIDIVEAPYMETPSPKDSALIENMRRDISDGEHG